MAKYICIRDDDTSYFTEPGELAYCYGKFWGKVPVTLATIPFVHGSAEKIWHVESASNKYKALREWELNATPDELSWYHRLHPIGDNREVVEELRPLIVDGTVEIAQHGVNHRYGEFGPEMEYNNVIFRGIRDGKEYLEKIFGNEVNVFVPPSNHIDSICADEVKKLGMDLLCCGSIYYANKIAKIVDAARYPLDTFNAIKNRIGKREWIPIKSRMGYQMVGSITYNPTFEYNDILKKVMTALEAHEFVSICTHYKWLSNRNDVCDKAYRFYFHKLLGELYSRSDVEFVCATEYIKLLKEGYHE